MNGKRVKLKLSGAKFCKRKLALNNNTFVIKTK